MKTGVSAAPPDTVVVDFADRADTSHPIPADFFGAGFSSFNGYSDLAWTMLKQAGFVNVRFDANLGQVWQSATATPDFSAIDQTVSFVASEGLKPIMIMDYCPSWLRTSSTDNMPADLSEWANLAAQYVHHEDFTFPGVIRNYEIWNEPDAASFLYAPNDSIRNCEYDSIFAAAAPKMYAQALADGDTIRVGGPTLATPNDMNVWLTSLLGDSDTAPYTGFVSYHFYAGGCSGWPNWTGMVYLLQNNISGVEATFNRFATLVKQGRQPDAAQTPIYIDEYNSNSCTISTDPYRNSPTYSPIWNGLFVTDLLNCAYNSSHTIPSKLLYFTSSYTTGGFYLLTNNFLPPKPYPQYYLYDLLAGEGYLGITNHGYLAHSVSNPNAYLSAAAFFTPNSESIVIVNPTSTDYFGLTVEFRNPGLAPSVDSLFILNQNYPTIKDSVMTSTATSGGYQSVIDVPPLSVVALKYATPITSVREGSTAVPKGFDLEQNYPNPFNPTTTISYKVPVRTLVNITVYDVLGRKVRTIVDAVEKPGSYSLTFTAGSLPSGVYFCRMNAGSFWQSIKIVLVK